MSFAAPPWCIVSTAYLVLGHEWRGEDMGPHVHPLPHDAHHAKVTEDGLQLDTLTYMHAYIHTSMHASTIEEKRDGAEGPIRG